MRSLRHGHTNDMRAWRAVFAVGGLCVALVAGASACGLIVGDSLGPLSVDGGRDAIGAPGAPDAAGDCPSGTKFCGTVCVPNDRPATGCASASCGACDVHGAAHCAGQCVIDQCDVGFRDCNGDPADGCETNITFDSKNCGECGHVCRDASGAGIGQCTNSECESFEVLGNQTKVFDLAADDAADGYVYFTVDNFADGQPPGIVGRVRKRGGAAETLYTASLAIVDPSGHHPDRPFRLLIHDHRIYWTSNNDIYYSIGTLHWADKDTGANHGSIGSWNTPAGIAADSQTLFWKIAQNSPGLLSLPFSAIGSGPDGGASAQPTVLYDRGAGEVVVVDSSPDGFAYWVDTADGVSNQIWRVRKSGTPGAELMLRDPQILAFLALDDAYLYYATKTQILRMDVTVATPASSAKVIIDLGTQIDWTTHYIAALMRDGDYVYVLVNSVDDAQLLRVTMDGKYLVLASHLIQLDSLSHDAWAIYWTSGNAGQIRKLWK